MARTLELKSNRIVLRFEQDQGHNRWIPLEDDDAIPHKQTYDFLVFLGKDPKSEDFCLTPEEMEQVLDIRYAIELKGCEKMLLENNIETTFDMIRWKDQEKRRWMGICRGERGIYGAPKFGRNAREVWEKFMGLVDERGPRNITR